MAKAKSKKSDNVSFEIKEGEFKGKYSLLVPKLNVPKIGIVGAMDLAKMPEVLEYLVKINSGAIQKEK